MIFEIDKCFTALNADRLKPGDIVITADSYPELIRLVQNGVPNGMIFRTDNSDEPFITTAQKSFAFAYFVKKSSLPLDEEIKLVKQASLKLDNIDRAEKTRKFDMKVFQEKSGCQPCFSALTAGGHFDNTDKNMCCTKTMVTAVSFTK